MSKNDNNQNNQNKVNMSMLIRRLQNSNIRCIHAETVYLTPSLLTTLPCGYTMGIVVFSVGLDCDNAASNILKDHVLYSDHYKFTGNIITYLLFSVLMFIMYCGLQAYFSFSTLYL